MSPTAALPEVAAIAAGTIRPVRRPEPCRNLPRPTDDLPLMHFRLLPVAAVVLALGACGDTGQSAPPTTVGCKVAEGGRVTLVADDNRWDTDCLQAPAGPLTIEVDNRDDGGNHNVHLPDAPDSPATELEQGPSTQELEATLEPGSYEFVCDVHSNMVGTLTVGEANPP